MNTELRKKTKNSFKKFFFKFDKEFSFWLSDGKYEKTQRHKACNNKKKRKLSGVRIKSSRKKKKF